MRKMLAAFVLVGLSLGTASAADKTAEQILKEIDAVKQPTFDRTKVGDQAAIAAFRKALQETSAKRAVLIGELKKADPSHEKLATLLPAYWQSMYHGQKSEFAAIAKDADEVRKATKNEAVKAMASFFKAQTAILGADDPAAALAAAEEFAKDAPKDPRVAAMLSLAADQQTDEAKALAVRKRILGDYPDSPAARSVKGAMKQAEGVGKPFELSFEEAIKGTKIDMASLKGKVVVIDFWATWCGPCVAEMPKMKDLYAKYKDQGVEFIGVSLDQPKDKGGLDALKKFVADEKIEWPQYYQGNFWQSDFSSSWGINSIPAVFIVDADGNLASVKARGKLDKLIPELMAKRKAAKP